MRISDALLTAVAILIAGCDQADPRVAAGTAPDRDAGRIACRLGGAPAFETACTAERTAGAGGQLLTLRGPDGGFRRVLASADGHRVTAADGAEPVTVTSAGGMMEIAVAGDHYRLPVR